MADGGWIVTVLAWCDSRATGERIVGLGLFAGNGSGVLFVLQLAAEDREAATGKRLGRPPPIRGDGSSDSNIRCEVRSRGNARFPRRDASRLRSRTSERMRVVVPAQCDVTLVVRGPRSVAAGCEHAELRSSTRCFLFTEAVDMRKSFRGLCQLAESVLKEDPGVGTLVCLYQPASGSFEAVGLGWARLLDLVQAARNGSLRKAGQRVGMTCRSKSTLRNCR